MNLLIGVMGEKGSGKGTFTKLFKEVSDRSIANIKSSDILAETLEAFKKEIEKLCCGLL